MVKLELKLEFGSKIVMTANANIYINSRMAEGVLLHPTLPVTFVGESVVLPDTTYTGNALTVTFTTVNDYDEPFFLFKGSTYSFYIRTAPVSGFKNKFTAEFERAYYYMETYRYYRGEGLPIYKAGFTITVGGVRG